MADSNFFKELKRRNVYRVAGVYTVAAWLIMQVTSIILPTFEAPEWVMKVIILLLVIGFPIALILAWAFEMSPQGIIRTPDLEAETELMPRSKKTRMITNLVVGILLLIIAGQFVFNKYWKNDRASENVVLTSGQSNSIAVLPFENLNGDPSQDYFSQGVSDEIRSQLASSSELKVISRSSSMFFKNQVLPMSEIQAALNVNYILGGRMWFSEDSLRLRVFLTDATLDREVWSSEALSGPIEKLIDIQDQITRQILIQLGIHSEVDTKRFSSNIDVDPPIYNLWLRAWSLHENYTPGDFKRAYDIGLEILSRDSTFALGYFLLGDYYLLNAVWFGGVSVEEGRNKAIPLFNKGLEIDPDNALCNVGLANSKLFFEYDFDLALSLFEKAEKRGEPRANLGLSMINIYIGEFEKAKQHLDNFVDLDPLNVFSGYFEGRILFFTGNPDEAIAILEEGIKKYKIADYYHTLGKIYLNLNKYEKTIETLEEGISATGQNSPAMLSDLAIAYFRLGNEEKCDEIIEDLKNRFENIGTGSPAFFLGQIYTGIDNLPQGLDWLEKSYDAGETEMIWLKIEPQFKKLANENRYMKLLALVGFPQ